ncbi:MAG: hypothetical protein AB7F09_27245 [Parvibaculaceae bacterium]
MATLVPVVMFAAVLAAFIAWAMAGLAALNVVSLAPKGEKLSVYFQLGLWRFAALEARLGAGVKPHLVRFKRAFYVFFAVVGAMVALSFAVVFLKTA